MRSVKGDYIVSTKALVKVDTVSGSRTYNRLDMQVSQTLHMAIELYDNLNYLFILDHYDDITLFDLDKDPLVVSYYQMKTSGDGTITIDSAISEDWLAKLYNQLSRQEDWLVNELGLITNTSLEICFKGINSCGKAYKQKQSINADKTKLGCVHQSVQDRIKKDIARKCGVLEDQVDLSKFVHIHTTLTIERHRDIVENEMMSFLYKKNSKITVDIVKGIYSSLIEILTKRQGYELLTSDAELESVKQYKGFTRTEFTNIIDKAIMLSLPSFGEVVRFSGVEETRLSLPYVQILTDSTKMDDESFNSLYNVVLKTMNEERFNNGETVWEYGHRIGDIIHKKKPLLKTPYDSNYIAVLVICSLINETRRMA